MTKYAELTRTIHQLAQELTQPNGKRPNADTLLILCQAASSESGFISDTDLIQKLGLRDSVIYRRGKELELRGLICRRRIGGFPGLEITADGKELMAQAIGSDAEKEGGVL